MKHQCPKMRRYIRATFIVAFSTIITKVLDTLSLFSEPYAMKMSRTPTLIEKITLVVGCLKVNNILVGRIAQITMQSGLPRGLGWENLS